MGSHSLSRGSRVSYPRFGSGLWLCQAVREHQEGEGNKMGNMLFNERVKDDIGLAAGGHGSQEKQKRVEHRIFPDHMYTGPLKLGDPYYRGLTKMETDPMLPARMRDTARSELCTEFFRVHTKGGIQPCIRLPEGKGRAGRLHRRMDAETRVPGSRGRRVFERAEPFSRDGGQDQALRQGHLHSQGRECGRAIPGQFRRLQTAETAGLGPILSGHRPTKVDKLRLRKKLARCLIIKKKLVRSIQNTELFLQSKKKK